jgi:ribose transport system ATP-binding protein
VADVEARQWSQPILEIHGLRKSFPGTVALDGVDLDLRGGEVHALVGQNGSGKSTLVKILAGFQDPDDGSRIELDGEELSVHDTSATHALGLRFVHQDLGLVDALDTVENLALGSGFETGFGARIRWADQREAARRRLGALGYDFDVRRPVRELNASERTGIAIARALENVESARVLVLDEPTASLPRHEVRILFAAINRVRELGLGVIYVSHRLDEIFAIADRVSILRDGRKVATLDTESLDDEQLVSLMIGRGRDASQRPELPDDERPVVLEVVNMRGVTVDGVDLIARRGEVLGIAGVTGSGRDELLSLIFGSAPRAGLVRVGGREVRSSDPSAAIAARMALVPAERHRVGCVLPMSVAENCTLTDVRRFARFAGLLSRRKELGEVKDWIASFDIRPPRPDAVFGTLSGGNQQKVMLAKWLRTKPQVLLLDEPSQGVDVGAKDKIHELARSAADDGVAVVMASSDDIELSERCDRILVMSHGAIVTELVGPEISPENLARAQLAATVEA